MKNQINEYAKYVGVCGFRYLDTFCEKIQENGEKTTGGCNKSLGCRRVNRFLVA